MADYFPVSYPPCLRDVGIELDGSVTGGGGADWGGERGGVPLLRFAVQKGIVPMSRVEPRAGPLLSRQLVQCRVSETLEAN